ncbi:MAG: hypothetical protein J3R72DRAFT_72760 [Linnemannia gamsii]|nr:MAG: hypothetical protein J3R72DRAFT_72760 [Linnemannia gamsii]
MVPSFLSVMNPFPFSLLFLAPFFVIFTSSSLSLYSNPLPSLLTHTLESRSPLDSIMSPVLHILPSFNPLSTSLPSYCPVLAHPALFFFFSFSFTHCILIQQTRGLFPCTVHVDISDSLSFLCLPFHAPHGFFLLQYRTLPLPSSTVFILLPEPCRYLFTFYSRQSTPFPTFLFLSLPYHFLLHTFFLRFHPCEK